MRVRAAGELAAVACALLLGPPGAVVNAQTYSNAAQGLHRMRGAVPRPPAGCKTAADCPAAKEVCKEDRADGRILFGNDECPVDTTCACVAAWPDDGGAKLKAGMRRPRRGTGPMAGDPDPEAARKRATGGQRQHGWDGDGGPDPKIQGKSHFQPSWAEDHPTEVLGHKKSWQRNWTHYHSRPDANLNVVEHHDYLEENGQVPKTPEAEARKGNHNWDAHADPDSPDVNMTLDEMRERHAQKPRGGALLAPVGKPEWQYSLSLQDWEECKKVDSVPMKTGKHHPLAYAVTAHLYHHDHCEHFCEAMHDQGCYKACDSSGGCYCDGKYDLSINHCLKKMATKVCVCSEVKHRDRGHEIWEEYDESKAILPRNHEPPKPHGEHDLAQQIEPFDGMDVKPPRHRTERQRAVETGTEEEYEKAKEARAKRRAERLREHDEKMATIERRRQERAHLHAAEALAAAAASAAHLKANPHEHPTVQELRAKAEADALFVSKLKDEL